MTPHPPARRPAPGPNSVPDSNWPPPQWIPPTSRLATAMAREEQQAGPLAAAGSAELRRFLGGHWAWMGRQPRLARREQALQRVEFSQYRNVISSTATREDDQA